MSRGKFIAFEGTDGAGKTTLINNVGDIMNSLIGKTVIIRNPSPDHIHYDRLRKMLADENTSGDELQFYMTKNFFDLMKTVEERLNRGINVLLDRWLISFFVYSMDNPRNQFWKVLARMNNLFTLSDSINWVQESLHIIDFKILTGLLANPSNIYPDLVFGLSAAWKTIKTRAEQRVKEGAKEPNDVDIERIRVHYNAYFNIFNSITRDETIYNILDTTMRFECPNFKLIPVPCVDSTETDHGKITAAYSMMEKQAYKEIGKLFKK